MPRFLHSGGDAGVTEAQVPDAQKLGHVKGIVAYYPGLATQGGQGFAHATHFQACVPLGELVRTAGMGTPDRAAGMH